MATVEGEDSRYGEDGDREKTEGDNDGSSGAVGVGLGMRLWEE